LLGDRALDDESTVAYEEQWVGIRINSIEVIGSREDLAHSCQKCSVFLLECGEEASLRRFVIRYRLKTLLAICQENHGVDR